MAQMGRPRVFDETKLEQLEELMRLYPSLEDTAAFFKCGTSTVEDTIRKHFDLTFREFREQNMVHTRLRLIRTAINKATDGDNVMLIFTLKNLCKWSDKHDSKVEMSGKVERVVVDLTEADEIQSVQATGELPS